MLDNLRDIIINKNSKNNAVWLMRQAGRYLPEFRAIRKENPNFIKLCLNKNLVPEITLQPLKRFDLDAAIIFSDILMVPYGLGQKVEFKKNFGPLLGKFKDKNFNNEDYINFSKNLLPIYESMKKLSNELEKKNKSLIGFVGAPWTILVYMLNRKSPKKNLTEDLTNNKKELVQIIKKINKFIKLHISRQVECGAQVIQIFDSWAGLVKERDLNELIYEPTKDLVDFTKSLKVPVICFPREIKNYKRYVHEVKPSAINIDYSVDIKYIAENIDIPVQGGLKPEVLLTSRDKLKKEVLKILNIFKNHPYIFNLGHGVLPQTDPNMVEYLVKIVKNY